MTPWQVAKQWWDEHNVQESFEQMLGWHLSRGLVYSTDEVFLCAHQTHWNGEECHDDLPPNAWFVTLAASAGHGNPVREFMRVASRPRQYALWCRHNQFTIRAFDWRKLARKVGL
jgi:hypothetical protein